GAGRPAQALLQPGRPARLPRRGSPPGTGPARMRRVKPDSTCEAEGAERRVEALLRGAADYEPAGPAPEGLAARAMAAWQARQGAPPHPRPARRAPAPRAGALWAMLAGILAAAGAACAAWSLAAFRSGPAPLPAGRVAEWKR